MPWDHVYLAAGFEKVTEQQHHSFGAELTGQVYELDLTAGRRAAAR